MSELGKVFTLERKHGVLVVVPQGDAVGFRLADIDHELQELLEQVRNEDKPKLVIDFGHANYFVRSSSAPSTSLPRLSRMGEAK